MHDDRNPQTVDCRWLLVAGLLIVYQHPRRLLFERSRRQNAFLLVTTIFVVLTKLHIIEYVDIEVETCNSHSLDLAI